MTPPGTSERERGPDKRLGKAIKQLKSKVERSFRRRRKSRSRSGSRTSRVPSLSVSTTHDTLPRRPETVETTKKDSPPVAPTDSPLSERNDVTTRPANGSLWAQAYTEAKKDPGFLRLLECYKEYLAERYGLSRNESADLLDPSTQRANTPIQKIARNALDDLESTRLAFRIGDRKIVIREQVKTILDFLTTFKGVIGAAAAAEPSASLAWTGVMAALPFLDNIVKQDESAADGFERISFIMVRYALLEKDLLGEKSKISVPMSAECFRVLESIKERVIKVYVIAYEYQIRIVLQYAHRKPRRMLGDMFTLNDWKTMINDIKEKDHEIDQAVNTAAQSSLRDELKRVDRSINDAMSKVVDLQNEISVKMDVRILDQIPYVENAVFNSRVIDKQGQCLPGTQRNALDALQKWTENPDGEPILWLAGMAGTGKSTIAATVANCLHDRKTFSDRIPGLDDRTFLGATFFLSHEDPERNTVKYVFPTIAKTLAVSFPDLGEKISQSIFHDSMVGHKKLLEQMQRLISEPLDLVSKTLAVSVRLIIIIDSLDECEDTSEAEELLRLLPSLGRFHPMDVRVLVVSRPEKHISQILDDSDLRVKKLTLEKIPPQMNDAVSDDITLFMISKLKDITKRRRLQQGWYTDDDFAKLVQKADGLFIYAATTCRFLDMTDIDKIQGQRLVKLLGGTTDRGTPDARLDEIYRKVLTFPTRDLSQYEKGIVFTSYRCILGIIALAFEPPSVATIGKLMKEEAGDRKTLMDFSSILEVPPDDISPVSFFHMSFRDFLLNKERSGSDFTIDNAEIHEYLMQNCLSILDESLHQDMCDLGHPGVFASDIPKARVNEHIPQHIKYACLYWSGHLSKLSTLKSLSTYLEDTGKIYNFLSKKLLFWLEVLSLLGDYHRSVPIIKQLQSLITPERSPKLFIFLQDAYRFVLANKDTIILAPLQTYSSALIFCPSKSIVRATFLSLIPRWITRYPDMRDEWGSELMTLHGASRNFDISRDGKTLISADFAGATRAFDTTTGFEMATFQHSSGVKRVAICRDNTTIASILESHTISIRSLTKEGETILIGGDKRIVSIAASPSDDILATRTGNYSIQLWDLKTLDLIEDIVFDGGDTYTDRTLAFSPCGQVLLAGCGVLTIGAIFLWDLTSQIQRKVKKHDGNIEAIAMSPDSERIASSDSGGSLKVWSKTTEAIQSETVSNNHVFSIAWHPKNPWILALGITEDSIHLCNIAGSAALMIQKVDNGGSTIEPLFGLAFIGGLSTLASADDNGCVRLWDIEAATEVVPAREMIRSIHFISSAMDMALIVSEGSSEILDLEKSNRKGCDTRKFVRSAAGDLCAFCSYEGSMEFWDRMHTNLIKSFPARIQEDYPVQFTDVFIPEDNSLVALMAMQSFLVLEYHTLEIRFQIDLRRDLLPQHSFILTSQSIGVVTAGDDEGSEQIWLFQRETGDLVPGFPHSRVMVYGRRLKFGSAVTTSPDGKLMIYRTKDENGIIYFVVVRAEEDHKTAILSIGKEEPSILPVFSPTSDYVSIGTESGEIFIWETRTMTMVKQLLTGPYRIMELHFCTGSRITVETRCGSIETQLWDVESGEMLETFEADWDALRVLSDAKKDRHHFSLKRGWVPLPTNDKTATCSILAERHPYVLDVEERWIWQGNDRILHLPPEFASHQQFWIHSFTSDTETNYPVVAASGDSMILGLEDGQVAHFRFDKLKMPFINGQNTKHSG
ncbi:WD domain-containing protein [Fusarium mundagurra]|uniref:WD domain-containing protein n=1 Tax=Fusarium mundagurra TaxID=1567541 RepID=A0A8H6D8L7_9HYPO|nr:WD domain-containing protein [Fusarium mundagurra]